MAHSDASKNAKTQSDVQNLQLEHFYPSGVRMLRSAHPMSSTDWA